MVATRHLTLMGQRQNIGFSSVMDDLHSCRLIAATCRKDDVTPVNADTPDEIDLLFRETIGTQLNEYGEYGSTQ